MCREVLNYNGCTYDLILGDCIAELPKMAAGSIDMILVDPPYGINFVNGWQRQGYGKIKNDDRPFVDFIPFCKGLLKSTGCMMVFSRWQNQGVFIDFMRIFNLEVKSCIVWDKVSHGMGDLKKSYGSRYETILFHPERDFRFLGKRPTDIVRVARDAGNAGNILHPTQKPVELMRTLVESNCPRGGVVLDMCMGSCPVGVACAQSGRSYIGIEIDKSYYEMACWRMLEVAYS